MPERYGAETRGRLQNDGFAGFQPFQVSQQIHIYFLIINGNGFKLKN